MVDFDTFFNEHEHISLTLWAHTWSELRETLLKIQFQFQVNFKNVNFGWPRQGKIEKLAISYLYLRIVRGVASVSCDVCEKILD